MKAHSRRLTLGGAAAALFLATTPAHVHPHVFAEARLDVVIDASAQVTALRHLWRFDDLFSSTVLFEFDKDKDLDLTGDELQEIADTIFASIAEFDYFQLVRVDGKNVRMKPPERLVAAFEDNQLVVLFESATPEPLKLAGKLEFGIYDPTFYTAIDFTDDANMAAEGLPQNCSRQVVRPDPDEAIAQNQGSLTDEFFNDPGGNDLGAIFATRLELTCRAEG